METYQRWGGVLGKTTMVPNPLLLRSRNNRLLLKTTTNPRYQPIRALGRSSRGDAEKLVQGHPVQSSFPKLMIHDSLRQATSLLNTTLFTCAAAATLFFSSTPSVQASSSILTFPIADNPELFAVQKTLVEAWTIVSEAYVDSTFNHVDWEQELSNDLTSIAKAPSKNDAAKQIVSMMTKLGDPFSRWVPPKDYQQFRVSSDGELKGGVGLLIAQDPASGRLVVLAPIKGSPADRAGIKPGDEVLAVDGASTAGMDGEAAAAVLRGEQGSSVMVEVARRQDDGAASSSSSSLKSTPPPPAIVNDAFLMEPIPGVPGRPVSGSETDGAVMGSATMELKRFRLQRETVELSPVFGTALHYDDHNFGYVRLVNFSQHAAVDMAKTIAQLKKDGAEAFILDLRNNPGGLVRSSLDIAGLWLNPSSHPVIFSVEDRGDAATTAATTAAATTAAAARVQQVVLSGGQAATNLPLVVLVNRQSASASEILAGALKDNNRAEVIGDRTFGKGKIQSVFELGDGSALFVTVAKYRTPNGTDIDQIGVKPDRACSALIPGGPASVPGIPVGPGADELVIEELTTDDCVLTAEALLGGRVDRDALLMQHL